VAELADAPDLGLGLEEVDALRCVCSGCVYAALPSWLASLNQAFQTATTHNSPHSIGSPKAAGRPNPPIPHTVISRGPTECPRRDFSKLSIFSIPLQKVKFHSFMKETHPIMSLQEGLGTRYFLRGYPLMLKILIPQVWSEIDSGFTPMQRLEARVVKFVSGNHC
jgi:hypothetical protein